MAAWPFLTQAVYWGKLVILTKIAELGMSNPHSCQ